MDAIKAWLGGTERQALAYPPDPHGRISTRCSRTYAATSLLSVDRKPRSRRAGAPRSRGDDLARLHAEAGVAAFWLAVELAAKAGAEHGRRAEARLTGEPAMTFDPAFTEVTALSPPARHRTVTFGELVDRYVANPSREVSPKTPGSGPGSALGAPGHPGPEHAIGIDQPRRLSPSAVDRAAATGQLHQAFAEAVAEKAVEHAAAHGVRPIAAKTATPIWARWRRCSGLPRARGSWTATRLGGYWSPAMQGQLIAGRFISTSCARC